MDARKPEKRYRVAHVLEDGRRVYLSTRGKIVVMPRREAEFWVQVANAVHTVEIDEMVYSADLLFYDRRSFFLERLLPFVRVVSSTIEPADVFPSENSLIIGGIRASEAAEQYRPAHDYRGSIVIVS